MNINAVAISGNLGSDAKTYETAGGGAVASFSVCVNERRKDQESGEWGDVPTWVRCVIFGARASGLAPHLKKGTRVAVAGRLRQTKWTTSEGATRESLEVVVAGLDFLSRRDEQRSQSRALDDECPF